MKMKRRNNWSLSWRLSSSGMLLGITRSVGEPVLRVRFQIAKPYKEGRGSLSTGLRQCRPVGIKVDEDDMAGPHVLLV